MAEKSFSDRLIEVTVGNGRVGADAVQIMLALTIHDPGPVAPYDIDRQRMIVVGPELLGKRNDLVVVEFINGGQNSFEADLYPQIL